MWMDRTEMVVRSGGQTGCIDVDVNMDMDMCAHVHAIEYMDMYMRLLVHLAKGCPFTLCSLSLFILGLLVYRQTGK